MLLEMELPSLPNALATIFFLRDRLFILFETVTSKATIEPTKTKMFVTFCCRAHLLGRA